jgi:hypothetical protein
VPMMDVSSWERKVTMVKLPRRTKSLRPVNCWPVGSLLLVVDTEGVRDSDLVDGSLVLMVDVMDVVDSAERRVGVAAMVAGCMLDLGINNTLDGIYRTKASL